MNKNLIETDITETELVANILQLFNEVASMTKSVRGALDQMNADSKDLDTNKP